MEQIWLQKNEQGYNGHCGRLGSLIVSVFNSVVSALGLSPGLGHCVVFLGKTLYSHSASFQTGV